MRIPSTGSFLLDMAIAFLIFLAGIAIAIKKGSRWGWLISGIALFWAYKLVAPFYN